MDNSVVLTQLQRKVNVVKQVIHETRKWWIQASLRYCLIAKIQLMWTYKKSLCFVIDFIWYMLNLQICVC